MRPRNVVQLRMRRKPKRPTHAEAMERLQRARAMLTAHIPADVECGDSVAWTLLQVRHDLTRIEQYLTGEV